MKNFAAITLVCALFGFSLVTFAAKGPCVFNGMSQNDSENFQYDKEGKKIGCIITTTESSNGFRCDGKNENECNTFYDPEAFKGTITKCTYEDMDGQWVMINTSQEIMQGDTKC